MFADVEEKKKKREESLVALIQATISLTCESLQ